MQTTSPHVVDTLGGMKNITPSVRIQESVVSRARGWPRTRATALLCTATVTQSRCSNPGLEPHVGA